MIQIYSPNNTNYEQNGDMVLFPTTCTVNTETWELEMKHITDEENRFKYIIEGAVVKAPSFNGEQLFRLFRVIKQDTYYEAYGNPIFFDSKDECLLNNVRITDKNGQEALDIITEGTKYSGVSNIVNISSAYYVKKNLMEAIVSVEENSFLNRWGGEPIYNNFEVVVNDFAGSDKGASLLYGKNIPLDGLTEEIDMSEVTTRIYPYSFNGYTLEYGECIDSPLINNYPKLFMKVVEYSHIKLVQDADGTEEEDVILCDTLDDLRAQLRLAVAEDYAKGIDKPRVSIEVDMDLLDGTTEYEDYKSLEKVSKGDIVHCKHNVLDIETEARVVNLVYDCVLDRVQSVVIGAMAYDYISDTSSVIKSASIVINTNTNTVVAEKIQGVINGLTTKFKYQKDVAQRQDVRAILFEDINPESSMYGAMSIGTQGIQITKTRNETDTDWDWTNSTAMDFQTIYANHILTGVLSDKLGNFYLDMDKGTLKMKDAEYSGKIIGSSFVATKTSQYTYIEDDIDIMANLFLSEEEPTEEQLLRYDLNQNGRVDSNDALIIQKLLQGYYGETNGVATIVDYISMNVENNGKFVLERRLNNTIITKTEYNSGSINKIGGSITIDGEPVITSISGTVARFG